MRDPLKEKVERFLDSSGELRFPHRDNLRSDAYRAGYKDGSTDIMTKITEILEQMCDPFNVSYEQIDIINEVKSKLEGL